jgi:hypothetical protein
VNKKVPFCPKNQKVGLNPHQITDFIGIFFEVVPGGGIEPPTRGFSMELLIYLYYFSMV